MVYEGRGTLGVAMPALPGGGGANVGFTLAGKGTTNLGTL